MRYESDDDVLRDECEQLQRELLEKAQVEREGDSWSVWVEYDGVCFATGKSEEEAWRRFAGALELHCEGVIEERDEKRAMK